LTATDIQHARNVAELTDEEFEKFVAVEPVMKVIERADRARVRKLLRERRGDDG